MTSSAAAVIRDDPRRLVVERRPLSALGPHDVLIGVRRVGICRSDVHLLHGDLDERLGITYPIIFGHEWSGDVLQTGTHVSRCRQGERVVGCNELGGNRWLGFNASGAATERMVVNEQLLFRIPRRMSYESAALVEPFACAFRGLQSIGGIGASDRVCILGAGTIGLCALLAATALGAQTIVVDPSPTRRHAALALGASIVVDPGEPGTLAHSVHEHLDGEATVIVEASGATAAIAASFELAGEGGRILLLGVCTDSTVAAPLARVQERSLRVAGSNGAPREVWAATLAFLKETDLDLSPMVTALFPLEQAPEAFEAAIFGASNIKVQIIASDERAC